jgi:hypothetical protein
VFYFFFGWMMGRNLRATRQAAYNAALPDSVKEERYAQQQAQEQARAAVKEAKRQHRREYYNAHPRAKFVEIVFLAAAVIAFLIYAFVFYSPHRHSVGTSIINAGTAPTPTTSPCAAGEVDIESASATAPSPPNCVPVSSLTGEERSVADNQASLCAPGHLILTAFSDGRVGARCG